MLVLHFSHLKIILKIRRLPFLVELFEIHVSKEHNEEVKVDERSLH